MEPPPPSKPRPAATSGISRVTLEGALAIEQEPRADGAHFRRWEQRLRRLGGDGRGVAVLADAGEGGGEEEEEEEELLVLHALELAKRARGRTPRPPSQAWSGGERRSQGTEPRRGAEAGSDGGEPSILYTSGVSGRRSASRVMERRRGEPRRGEEPRSGAKAESRRVAPSILYTSEA